MKTSVEIEKKIEDIINKMTLEEKVAMCHANSKFNSNGVERLGIEELTMMDGPHGVRSEPARHEWTCLNREEDKCTYLPTETALAATFNPELARLFGETLGSEARYRGKDIILGPGVNIIRTPLCGRNFEYMSEDPCLIGKMSPELVKGIESQDTAACVKHYALNNQELDRAKVNVEVSRRALHEIYLKGFYSAIIEGGASSVMGAYNKYENQHCCHNDYLVNKILKDKWGFKGVYLTDWSGAHDTDESIYNGLDIEMGTMKPYNEYYLADAFLEKAKESEEVRNILDDKVRRILRLMLSINKLSPDRKEGEFNTKVHQQATYDIAAEGMVLLKNEEDVLPIDKKKLKKLLVVGPNADAKHAEGGSSSGIRPFYEITPLQGIKDRLSDICEIDYESGVFDIEYKSIPMQNLGIVDLGAGCRNYKVSSHTLTDGDNTITEEKLCETADIIGGHADIYDTVFKIEVPESGNYSFKIALNCNGSVDFNGINYSTIEYTGLQAHGWDRFATWSMNLTKGEVIEAKIHIERSRVSEVNATFGWITPSVFAASSSKEQILLKAKESDYVIYCGGLDHSFDTESLDKKTMHLPSEQDAIIPELIAANPNTIITLTAGSPVSLPWIDKAKAVIWSWYAGMEGGHVLADTLTGDICPSGKMPFTLPKNYGDTPVARYGEYKSENCKYNEDILVGYRAFDYDNIEPIFPFGHGLSYSSFEYSDLNIIKDSDGFTVNFKVTNTGSVKAKETAQVYIGDPVCSVMRPPKELRNFKKVELNVGESAEISLQITALDLSYFDEVTEDWKLENGEFTVFVGSSSRDIRLRGSVEI